MKLKFYEDIYDRKITIKNKKIWKKNVFQHKKQRFSFKVRFSMSLVAYAHIRCVKVGYFLNRVYVFAFEGMNSNARSGL